MTWRVEDVQVGSYWLDEGGQLHEVIATTDKPTVTVKNLKTNARVSHVIESPNFARFVRLARIWSDGSRDT